MGHSSDFLLIPRKEKHSN